MINTHLDNVSELALAQPADHRLTDDNFVNPIKSIGIMRLMRSVDSVLLGCNSLRLFPHQPWTLGLLNGEFRQWMQRYCLVDVLLLIHVSFLMHPTFVLQSKQMGFSYGQMTELRFGNGPLCV